MGRLGRHHAANSEIAAQFHGRAAAPSGDPPETNPQASSVSLRASSADCSPFEIEPASYSNHAIHIGETTFKEAGTISFGDGADGLDIESVGEGTLEPRQIRNSSMEP